MEEETNDQRAVRLLKSFIDEYTVASGPPHSDSLRECFALQRGFMAMLRDDGRFPAWPLDLSSKENQRKLQALLWDMVREVAEASATLKNRVHRVKEESFDRAEYLEEMCDAFAFWMEDLIVAGFTMEEVFDEYRRKNAIVRQALIDKER